MTENTPTDKTASADARERIAVIGSGISGMAAAWLLSQRYRVTLIEARERLGGHTATKYVPTADGGQQFVDTGFIVYNARNYPNLIALFEHLGVETQPSNMSFGVSIDSARIEWAGSASYASLFAQRRNALKPSHYRMLLDIVRFNKATKSLLESGSVPRMTVGEYLDENRYSAPFRSRYLLPMAACIWSCPTGQVLEFPLRSFLTFFRNHGLLDLADRPQWRTVTGGSANYIPKLTAGLDDIRLSSPVAQIKREDDGVEITFKGGKSEHFDHAVLACHSDQALAMLSDPDEAETDVLGAIPYGANRVVLHTDAAQMPRRTRAWASWNYLADRDHVSQQDVSLTYWMNNLQGQPQPPEGEHLFVTVNPITEPDPAKVIDEYSYAHPVFSMGAVDAQERLPEIQGQHRTYFCGAWAGYGFHEDGLRAGIEVAALLGCEPPWA